MWTLGVGLALAFSGMEKAAERYWIRVATTSPSYTSDVIRFLRGKDVEATAMRIGVGTIGILVRRDQAGRAKLLLQRYAHDHKLIRLGVGEF